MCETFLLHIGFRIELNDLNEFMRLVVTTIDVRQHHVWLLKDYWSLTCHSDDEGNTDEE